MSLLAWGLGMMALGAGFGWAQETMVEYALTAPLVVEGKNGVIIERLHFRRRLPPGQAAVQIRGSTNILVRNCAFAGIGPGIVIQGGENVRIENCAFIDLYEAGMQGLVPQIGVESYQVRGLSVEGCLFEFVACGLYAASSEGVIFRKNAAFNMLGPYPRGQAVQFGRVTGRGNVIEDNFVLNESGISFPQDCINLFESFGTPDSPIRVERNLIRGDPERGSHGQSASGSGIMAGDGGGAFQMIRQNEMDSPGQAGIGVASGSDIEVSENKVRGMASAVSNVGISVWNQYPAKGGQVTVASNLVGWRNKKSQLNNFWSGKAKMGPAYEFSQVTFIDNREVFPEEIEIDGTLPLEPWLFMEGAKYSQRLRMSGARWDHLFDPSKD